MRYIVAFDSVEEEITNGGWAQLLWNTYPNWRELLEIAREGYAYFGDDHRASTIAKLSKVFGEHENDCAKYMQKCIDEESFNKNFAEFTYRGYGSKPLYGEEIFFSDGPRLTWLVEKRRVIEAVIGT
ncbi:DMP19 family protein [Noviherbaspirillum massiliense]|uniref:DMP19 family protein n=1 Tax=Noviherbaspirillum massiliense TaxID=1465823 RepID=UPI0009468F5B|nr:DUF4375 domain-containing protein [Noviherbaspirillum massiliense]